MHQHRFRRVSAQANNGAQRLLCRSHNPAILDQLSQNN
jgi:hypothetical protein